MKTIEEKIIPVADCMMWSAGTHMQGYPMMRDPRNTSKMILVARYLMEEKLGYRLDKDTRVKNTCGNLRCVNPDHYDVIDREDMGRWKCTPHYIKEDKRQEIRDEYNNTEKYHGQKRDLKHKYRITYETLNRILSGN